MTSGTCKPKETSLKEAARAQLRLDDGQFELRPLQSPLPGLVRALKSAEAQVAFVSCAIASLPFC
jgi:hypothetical protein